MLLEFIAVIVAGVGGGGVGHLLRRLSARRLPEWLTPAGAASAMLAMVIYLEYSWAPRYTAGLPDEIIVVSQNQHSVWYRPWTHVVPLTNRIIAVDNRIRQRSTANPDLVRTGVILQERWALTMGFESIFDCANARRTDMTANMRMGEDGLPQNAEWYQLAEEDPFLLAACEGGAHGGQPEEG